MFSEEKKGSSSRKSCQQCETKNLKEISSETFLVSNFFKTDSKTFSVLNFSETVSKTFYGTNFVWDRYYRTRQKYKRLGNGIPRRDPNRRQDQFQDFFTLFCFGSSHPPPPPPPAPPPRCHWLLSIHWPRSSSWLYNTLVGTTDFLGWVFGTINE